MELAIGEALKDPQRQLWKEVLFVQYDKNKDGGILSAPIPMKSLPEGTKVNTFTHPPKY